MCFHLPDVGFCCRSSGREGNVPVTHFPCSSDPYSVTSSVVLHTPALGFSERLKSVNVRPYPPGDVLGIISSNVFLPRSLSFLFRLHLDLLILSRSSLRLCASYRLFPLSSTHRIISTQLSSRSLILSFITHSSVKPSQSVFTSDVLFSCKNFFFNKFYFSAEFSCLYSR